MKLKTSFFNKTALRKDILRYSPIWGLYTVFLLLVLFALADDASPYMADNVLDFVRGMAWVNLLYGGICGAFLFMDLFNGRLCNGLHAFPMRREGWLITHILSGFLFSLIPNLLVALLGSFMLWEYAYVALIWLAVSMLQYLFFFGTAVLSAMCAGNLLGTAAIYGIFHFITVLLYAVMELLYQPLLYGVRFYTADFYRFFPLYKLTEFHYADFTVSYSEINTSSYGVLEGFCGADWRYAGICAAVGVLCIVLACLVYRRRNLETAGDFISLRPLAPVFLVICAIGAGCILYLFSDLFNSASYLFLVLGMVIGYFAGRMLLERTLKVFGKKSLIGFGVLAAVLAGSLWLTWLDPVGVTTYVPSIDKVESAAIQGADKGYYYHEFGLSYVGDDRSLNYQITDPEELVHLQDFHRQLTRYRPDDGDGTLCDVQVTYTLKNGKTVSRYYEVGRDTVLGERAGRYFSDMRYIFDVNDISALCIVFESVAIDSYSVKPEESIKLTDAQQIMGLLSVIKSDCEAGVMAQNWAYHEKSEVTYFLEFYVSDKVFENGGWSTSRFHLRVWPECTNTVAYLNQIKAQYYLENQ